MNMKHRALTLAIMSISLGLTGCAGVGWSVKTSCSGSNCSVEGEIHGGPQQKRTANHAKDTWLANTTPSATDLPSIDAVNIVIDTSGSSVNVPLTGNITLKLLDSASGFVFASRTFSWVRSGPELRLSNPTDVNSWIQENGAGADDVQYVLAPFAITEATGLNSFSTAVSYAGETQAASTYTWTGSGGGSCTLCQEK
jgi:hypothetical protein